MSEDTNEADDETLPDEQSQSMLAHTERIFLRLTFWQTVLSVVGAFIAVVALYAALTESAAVRQQTAAAVWPFVQLSVEDSDTGESAKFTMSFTNAGVGPAKMRTMRLVINREPVRDWANAVTRLGGQLTDNMNRNFISNRVLSPNERVDAFHTNDPELARRFQAVMDNPESYLTFCYCSIFDECWVADSRQDLQDPDIVEECPNFGDAAFRN
ncbi:MAG TPA: hypothetical protein PKH39_02890 [Woeseiaceae bacterium]|nr:hypothetical protein [Woeseiaceae bacterium]